MLMPRPANRGHSKFDQALACIDFAAAAAGFGGAGG